MKQHSQPEIPQQAYELYDQYAHGMIDRRTFLRSLGKISVAGLSAGSLFTLLAPKYAQAEQVSFYDPDIKPQFQKFESPQGHGSGRGYLVYPAKLDQPKPTVLVIHENRGLNPYIKDVARRLAKSGFIAFAPDALYPVGGYPGNDDEGRTLQRSLDRDKMVQDFFAATRFLKTIKQSNGKLGVVGFCFGGSMTNKLAAELPDLVNAAVPFYGSPPELEKVKDIKAPLMIQMGDLDKRVNARWPDYEISLNRHDISYSAYVYPNSNHGFHNDSTPRYNPETAELAWSRTLAFFNEHLG